MRSLICFSAPNARSATGAQPQSTAPRSTSIPICMVSTGLRSDAEKQTTWTSGTAQTVLKAADPSYQYGIIISSPVYSSISAHATEYALVQTSSSASASSASLGSVGMTTTSSPSAYQSSGATASSARQQQPSFSFVVAPTATPTKSWAAREMMTPRMATCALLVLVVAMVN